MFRPLIGAAVGVAVTVALLMTTYRVLAWHTAPRELAIDHGVVYLSVVLGAGFGALSGACLRREGNT